VCTNSDCLTQFTFSDLENGADYLSDLESHYLVGPSDRPPPIPLAEYGAAWLFVRWVTEHFGQPPAFGTDVTQRLVQTDMIGSDNVSAVTSVPFSTLVTQWQMANYLDNLPGFTPSDPRLQYQSWDFRQVYDSLNGGYPLAPDSTAGAYSHTGQLLAGSGRHVLIAQPPSSGEVDFTLTGTGGTTALPASPPYDHPHASDVQLADLLELCNEPLADGAGPYDPDPPSDPFDTRPVPEPLGRPAPG
jgi:hypothetical protein